MEKLLESGPISSIKINVTDRQTHYSTVIAPLFLGIIVLCLERMNRRAEAFKAGGDVTA